VKKTGFHIVVALVVVLELVMLGRQFRARAKLSGENQALELLAVRLAAAENAPLARLGATAADSSSRSGSQRDELNRLESQAQDQQRRIQDLQAALAALPTLPAFQSLAGSNRFVNIPKAAWTSSGYSTPEAALESMLWATLQGDLDTLRASLTPAELERRNKGAWKGKTDSEIADAGMQGLSQVSGIQVLNLQRPSDTSAHFTVYVSGLPQPDQPLWMDMLLIDGEWKSDAREHRLAGN
jgi:hypothetical protein